MASSNLVSCYVILYPSKEKKKERVEKDKSILTPCSIYHLVVQRSKLWEELRKKRFGGSQLGPGVGICRYTSTQQFFDRSIDPLYKFESNAPCEHGTAKEPFSFKYFKAWLNTRSCADFNSIQFASKSSPPSYEKIMAWASQEYADIEGYDTPNSKHNPWFSNKIDESLFGSSLDGRGSLIDLEIKNPFTYLSFYKHYTDGISPSYFAQVQWAMAIRGRSEMFFIATSYTKDEDPTLLAAVIYHISFSKDFFQNFLYPNARKMITLIRRHYGLKSISIEKKVQWINDKNDKYRSSDEYKELLSKHCTKVFFFKDGPAISREIRKNQK